MRTLEKVTIKATESVMLMAQKALDVQDAVNPYAVGTLFMNIQHYFREAPDQERYGSDMGIQNPICITLLNKLNDLAGLEQSRTECFTACQDLAEGKDVEWEINFLS